MKIKICENNEIKEIEFVEEENNVNSQIYQKETSIVDKKIELINSDYKILKIYEAQILNKESPYNSQEIINYRQALRDDINVLETEIEVLKNGH